ncbi:SOUL family heme-binding protein [Halorubrum trapanicum]|uniref:SOUL family heme-binding protein n=1 Tax=Halorubrum trapanicum TaxID=29284 RepID=UPI003C704EFB
MRPLTKALLVGGGAAFAGWVGWGIYSTREAEAVPYETLRTVDGVELRRYPRTVLVETTAPTQRRAFRRLFEYISGANRGDESISMTAPVQTRNGKSISMTAPVRSEAAATDADAVRMGFYLPAEYGPDTAPEPTASDVSLVTEPPKRVAVDRFSWYAPEWRVERRTRQLRSALEREGIEPAGEPYLLRYDDPWTPPFMRRNEVAVAVAEAE